MTHLVVEVSEGDPSAYDGIGLSVGRSLAALEVDVFEAAASTKGDVAIVLGDTATDTNVSLILDSAEADALRDGLGEALRSGRTVEP